MLSNSFASDKTANLYANHNSTGGKNVQVYLYPYHHLTIKDP